MNPDISEGENAQHLDFALEVADSFRVSAKRGHAIIEEVFAGAKRWRSIGETIRIASGEIERMEPAYHSLQVGRDRRASALVGRPRGP